MNIANDLLAYVRAQLPDLYGPIVLDAFPVEPEEALMLRADPSNAAEKGFIDGSFCGTAQLSFYARGASPAVAIDALDDIRKALDQPELVLTDVLCAQVLPLTLPAFVSQNESGASTYYFTVAVDYDGNNPQGV